MYTVQYRCLYRDHWYEATTEPVEWYAALGLAAQLRYPHNRAIRIVRDADLAVVAQWG